MNLQNKYADLVAEAHRLEIADLLITEQENVLYINGTANSTADKNKLWESYGKIDPDFRSADVVMNITIAEGAETDYTVVSGDSLSKIGKAHGVSWQSIFNANKDIIKNPDVIQPGWKLKIPSK